MTTQKINGVSFQVLTIGNKKSYMSEELNGFSSVFVGGSDKFIIINHRNGKQVEIETTQDVAERASKTLKAQSKMNFCTIKGLS